MNQDTHETQDNQVAQESSESTPPDGQNESGSQEANADNSQKTIAPVLPVQPVAPEPALVVQANASADPSALATALANAKSAARKDALADALVIAELCQLAGQSSRTAGFLAQGVTTDQVRQTLLQARAKSEEISSLIHPEAQARSAATHSGVGAALIAAVKKLNPA